MFNDQQWRKENWVAPTDFTSFPSPVSMLQIPFDIWAPGPVCVCVCVFVLV